MTNRKLKNYWKKNFTEAGVLPDLRDEYLSYIDNLIKNDVPIIFDFDHLCLLLGRSPSYLASVVNCNSSHYREFIIPKRSGGERIITAPYPALLDCQSWIYHNILKKIAINPAAQGFTKNKSIITNANNHIGKAHFLKVDLKDFFTSIKINYVIAIFKKLGYTHNVSFYLSAICCFDNFVPQGAPTSPAISNIVSIKMDKRLLALAKRFNLRYTRYADDLAFSGNEIPSRILEYISRITSDEGFEINEKKTILSKDKGKRIVTGISIAGEKIALPREYKRTLKNEIHYITKYGLQSHIRKMKIKDPNYAFSVIGKLNFWLSIEKDNIFAKNALLFLSKIKID